MVGIELVKDRTTHEPYALEARMGHRVVMEARRRGLLLRPIGNVIVLMPPLVTSINELTDISEIIYQSIATITEA